MFVFKVMFRCIVSAYVSYYYRVASPGAAERLPAIDFLRPGNVFIGRGS
jgi:hypothetical protein